MVALAGLAACGDTRPALPDQTPPSAWVVEPTGIGPLHIGMSVAEARRALRIAARDSTTTLESCGYLDTQGSPVHVGVMVEHDTVVRIEARDSTVATAAGARVGDREARILDLYRGHVRVEPHKYLGPAGHYLVITQPGDTVDQIIFETDGKRVLNFRAGRLPAVAYVEGCS